jgi:cystathionine gamma-synthase
MTLPKDASPATLAAQALGPIDATTKALVPPIYTSTTYQRDADNGYSTGNIYARSDNPTFKPAEALLTELEKGHASLLFGSGMAAATAVFLALDPGDHVIAPKVMYWSLRAWLTSFATRWGLQVELVDMSDASAIKAALRPGKTKLIWIETPANPMWSLTDIAHAAELARSVGARLAVDSTVATPVLTQPLTLGADIVMHAATKYLNGHSDVMSGSLTGARDDEFWQRIRLNRSQIGAIPGPQDAWLLLRGMRTLFPRVRTACANAMAIAERFDGDPRVSQVLYPGLPGFNGHDVAARQMKGGFGGMLSIRVARGPEAAIATAARTEIWKRATSLGGVESLIEHRASIEGPTSPVPQDLLRLSAGIEDVGDLIADLDRALGN